MKFNLRKFKPTYWLYNLLHYKLLLHNKQSFKEYGINKPLFATLSAKDFPDKESRAWLDLQDSSQIAETKKEFLNFSNNIQESIKLWSTNGFLILNNFFDDVTILQINNEIELLLNTGRIKFENGGKIMFANKKSELIKNITLNKRLCSILSFLLGKEVIPFQTINFIKGSEQRGHSDSIHMTTYPLGYLIAVWIALEDITDECGPLFYYPESHKLPFVLNNDFNTGETFLFLGKKNYGDYENVMEENVIKKGFKKKVFLARRGDAFIWHANLVHGGSPILNKNLTRKSMVIHYFAKDVIKYHEITERPSLMEIEKSSN